MAWSRTDKNNLPRVLVMMATYNGAAWVRDQIESILDQTDVDVTLRICDDRSNDGTYELCARYADALDNVIVTCNRANVGVAQNFMQMVYEDEAAGFDYYAFADQDDVWAQDKLARAVRRIEQEPASAPVLYYSDVLNIDENGGSYEISQFRGCERHKATVLVRNVVNGCAMVWNAALNDIVRSYRPSTFPRLHDVWLHMAGCFCGEVVDDYDSVSVYRRITGKNVVGRNQTDVRDAAGLKALARLALSRYERASSAAARLFYDGYRAHLTDEGEQILREFVGYRSSLPARVRIACSGRYWLPTPQMRLRMRMGFLLGFY